MVFWAIFCFAALLNPSQPPHLVCGNYTPAPEIVAGFYVGPVFCAKAVVVPDRILGKNFYLY